MKRSIAASLEAAIIDKGSASAERLEARLSIPIFNLEAGVAEMMPSLCLATAFRQVLATIRNAALIGLSAVAVVASADSAPASIETELPESLSTAFPANNVTFSHTERSRIERATRHLFDRYGEELAGHSEYEAMLPLGDDWRISLRLSKKRWEQAERATTMRRDCARLR